MPSVHPPLVETPAGENLVAPSIKPQDNADGATGSIGDEKALTAPWRGLAFRRDRWEMAVEREGKSAYNWGEKGFGSCE